MRLDLRDVTVVGFSLGGWIAAEMATKNDARFAQLVLVDPYGIKLGGPHGRAISPTMLPRCIPTRSPSCAGSIRENGMRDYKAMAEDDLRTIARNRESFARFLLGAVSCTIPSCSTGCTASASRRCSLWGESDGIVTPALRRGVSRADPRREARDRSPRPATPASRAVRRASCSTSTRFWQEPDVACEPGTSPRCPIRISARRAAASRASRCRTSISIPRVGAELYHRYLDEHMIADELGLDIMLNEHHQIAGLHRRRRAALRRDPRAPDEEGAHLHPRQPDRPTAKTRSASPRRWR